MGDEAAQEGIKEPQSGWEVEEEGYTLTSSYQQVLHKTGYKRFCERMWGPLVVLSVWFALIWECSSLRRSTTTKSCTFFHKVSFYLYKSWWCQMPTLSPRNSVTDLWLQICFVRNIIQSKLYVIDIELLNCSQLTVYLFSFLSFFNSIFVITKTWWISVCTVRVMCMSFNSINLLALLCNIRMSSLVGMEVWASL